MFIKTIKCLILLDFTRNTYPSEKCNVETRRVVIHKLEGKQFYDQGIIIFSLSPVVFCKKMQYRLLKYRQFPEDFFSLPLFHLFSLELTPVS